MTTANSTCVLFAMTQPEDVDIHEILFRSTKQELGGDNLRTKLTTAAVALSMCLSVAFATEPPAIVVTRVGSQPSEAGPEKNFTGSVRVDSRFQAPAPARVGGGIVTFEPGARTAWHTHPLGQTLIVTAGVGRVQKWGDPVQEIRPGDAVWIPPGVKHWHGAGPTTGMTHVAISEQLDGKGVDWLEKVSDEQSDKARKR